MQLHMHMPLIFFVPYAYAYHMQAYACDMHMHVICAYAFDNTAHVNGLMDWSLSLVQKYYRIHFFNIITIQLFYNNIVLFGFFREFQI